MSRPSQRRRDGRSTLDLLEESVHLVRTVPPAVLATYYLGSIPFVLAFLYFWSDMSRSAFAVERCAPLAGGLALLFVWMKCGHVVFARMLREHIIGARLPALSAGEWLGVAGSQTFWHATGFIVLPVAFTIVIPTGWCVAFYQNLTAIGAAGTEGSQRPFREAARHTRLWPGQNHAALGTLSGVGLVVFVNVMILLFAVPFLIKTLFGVETSFSQSAWAMANSTFLAVAGALTWLMLDPVLKAFYALRCFHGDALSTGEDIRVELRGFKRSIASTAISVALFLALTGTLSAGTGRPGQQSEHRLAGHFSVPMNGLGTLLVASSPQPFIAAVSSPETSPTELSPLQTSSELDEAIDNVLQRREYAWRMPREELAPADAAGAGWLQRNIERVLDWTGRQIRSIGQSVMEVVRWIFDKLFGNRNGPPRTSGVGWENAVRGMFILLIVGLVAALGYLGYRLWKHHRPIPIVEAAAAAAPDLNDDNLTAAQLPEDEWIRLARELIARGELRLAVRAFYLAGLAHLADRGLVTIARYKSNHEYARELGRRSHALPEVVGAFAEHVSTFDRVWYGDHHATPDLLNQVESNLRRIAAA